MNSCECRETADIFIRNMLSQVKSSQVELYCHSATCVDIQWNEMLCLTGPRCYMNTDIQRVKQYKPIHN